MNSILLFVHALLCFVLIGMVLVQRGTGADMGGGFGGGASQTVFGSQGSASFLTRATAVLATLFFVSCLVLAYLVMNSNGAETGSIMTQLPAVEQTISAPVYEDIPVINEEESSIPIVPAE